MKKYSNIVSVLLATIVMMMAIASCSTQKNTAQTRWWHAFTGRYNTYYNGTLAYIDGSLEKENGVKDNFTEQIPLYSVSYKDCRETGKGNFDKAIEKCEKTIKLHSITKRPQWTKNKKKTERDIEWLNRKEYNPFLWRAWMLMGRSQFYKGAFDEAASTFTYMSRLYRTQPVIYAKARAWLAKCYIEEGWLYDAEDVIRNMQRDSIDWRAMKEWNYTYADYYLATGDKENAIKYLKKVIKQEMRSKQRAREYFLLGQLEASLNHRKEAYKAYSKVISQNPPYQVAFNARIAMTEVLADAGQAKKMIGRLRRMARNDNNAEYLDQVYYAIGNIYLSQKDTVNAIIAYEKGNAKATRSGIEKGVLLLRLGDIYWEREQFSDAGRCYGEAIGLLDKDRPDYKQLSQRSKVLDELVPYTDAVHLQDSLQSLAKMSEKDRNAAIDRVITALKKKEKEEKDKKAAEDAARQQNQGTGRTIGSDMVKYDKNTIIKKTDSWYFYNPTAVQQGKLAFEKTWGKRENADNWQRANKTVVDSFSDEADNESSQFTEEQRDSIAKAEEQQAQKDEKADSAANDPHKREYYLAQIPFTEEQVAASNELIKDGLYHAGIIFKDKLDNLRLSEKELYRLMNDFPEFDKMDEVYYHMFLLYSRKGDKTKADSYITMLKDKYPQSEWTTILTDPYFEENARFGRHIEDSLYTATYDAFLHNRFDEVKTNTTISDTRFVKGDNRDKFLFISGLSLLNEGDADSCLARMNTVVKDFPQSEVSPIAGMIINGVNEGRKLRGAQFDMSDVWNRRTSVMADSDSIAAQAFSDERNIPFTFLLAYVPDSVNENQLLYQLARFNFTSFVVRNFNIEIEEADGLHHMIVNGFRSFDEARMYARVLLQNEAIKALTRKCHPIVISDANLAMLGSRYSYNDYDKFYSEHFQSLNISTDYMLYEPDGVRETKDTNEVAPALPSLQVAPGGVAPVKEKKDGEEEGGETDGKEDITLPAEDDSTPKTDDIIINDEPAIQSATPNVEDIITVPMEEERNTDSPTEETITVPAEQNTKDDSSTEGSVPVEENKATDNDSSIVNDDSSKKQSTESDDTFFLDDSTESKQNVNTDDTFILDDGASKKKEDSKLLEDEYYELEGF